MMGTKVRTFAPLADLSLEQLVPADCFYRRLDRVLDLAFVRDLVQPYYAGCGRPSVDPVVFFKLQLVMFFEGIRSERQLMRVVADRLSVRWYLGYDLHESLPDHSSLTRIRDRFGLDCFRRFFDAVVERCIAAGLVWGAELFFDASKIQANAASTSMVPRFAVEAHLAACFPDTPLLTAPSEIAERNAPVAIPVVLPQATREALAEANDTRHDWVAQGGQQQRDVVGRDYRRIADYHASRTDPDAALLPGRGGGSHPGYQLHYVADGGKARVVLAALVTPAEVIPLANAMTR